MHDLRVLDALWTHGNVSMVYTSNEGVLLEVNPAFCRMVGFSEAELQGRHFRLITHPADIEADEEMFRRVVAGEISQYEMIKSFIHKDGHAMLVRMLVFPIRKSDGSIEFLVKELIVATPSFVAPSVMPKTPGFFSTHSALISRLLTALVGFITALTVLASDHSLL